MYTGPKLITESLAFGFDTGYGVADKHTSTIFYKGEPATNLKSGTQTSGILNGMSGVSLAHVGEEDGYQKYSMDGTFSGGSYPYIMRLANQSFTGGVKYSTQAKVKTNVPNKFNYFGSNGVSYVNQPMDHSGTLSSTLQDDGCYLVKREGFAYTSTTSQAGYLWTNPINNTTFSSSTDFVYVKDFQIEQNDHCTPYTASSRGNNDSLIDLTRTRDVQIDNSSFDSTCQPILDGTGDDIDLGADVDFASDREEWTVESVVKYSSVAGAYNNTTSPANFIGADSIQHNSWYWSVLGGYLAIWNISPGVWKYGSTAIQADTWYHVVLTVGPGGTSYQMYLNGVAEGGTHVGYDFNAEYSGLRVRYFGRGSQSNRRNVDGHIAVTRIYQKRLTAAEVKQNFDAYKNRFNI